MLTATQFNPVATSGLTEECISVRRLSARNGKDAWIYLTNGNLHRHERIGKDKLFLITTSGTPREPCRRLRRSRPSPSSRMPGPIEPGIRMRRHKCSVW